MRTARRVEMCGNGIRCVGKYVYDYGLTDKTSVSIETLAGIKYLEFTFGDEEKRTEDSRTCACQMGARFLHQRTYQWICRMQGISCRIIQSW